MPFPVTKELINFQDHITKIFIVWEVMDPVFFIPDLTKVFVLPEPKVSEKSSTNATGQSSRLGEFEQNVFGNISGDR